MVSGGNFIMNLLLARQLSQDDYGEFALLLSAIFVLRAVDYSFISYPFSVRLSTTTAGERPRLLASTALLAVALSLVLVVAMALATMLLEEDNILLPACLCFLCWQAQETSRRFLLGDFRHREAVPGDGLAFFGQGLLMAVLGWMDSLTLATALYAMSATFVLGALVHVSKLRFAMPDFSELRGLVVEYFSLGRWSFVSYELVLVRAQLFAWTLAATAGPAATASLQAGLNIANTMNPINFGIGNAIPQVAAHAHRTGGVIGAWRAAQGYILFGLVPIVLIGAAIAILPEHLLQIAYGPSSPYLTAAFGLQLLAFAGVLDYVAEMISKTLLGVQAGRLAFVVNVVAFGVAAVLAFGLVGTLGVFGACLAMLLANLVRVAGGVIAIVRLITGETARGEASLIGRT